MFLSTPHLPFMATKSERLYKISNHSFLRIFLPINSPRSHTFFDKRWVQDGKLLQEK